MSIKNLFAEYESNPNECWIDVYCRGKKWFIVLGAERSRQGTVYPVRIGEARRFLRHVHGASEGIILSAKKANDMGYPLGVPVSVAAQLA